MILAVRNVSKGEKVLSEIKGTGQGLVMQLDTSDMDSVKKFATDFQDLKLPLHFLVLNAGISGFPSFSVAKQGWEATFSTNHMGHFLLTRLLEPNLLGTGSREHSCLFDPEGVAEAGWLAKFWRARSRLYGQLR